MYSEMFSMGGPRRRNATSGGAGATTPEQPPLVSFLAGPIDIEYNDTDKHYKCTPQNLRGQVRLTLSTNATTASSGTTAAQPSQAQLMWQFYDRRSEKVVSTEVIPNSGGGSFERVDLTSTGKNSKAYVNDRVYVWKKATPGRYQLYWMQSADDSNEDEVVAQVNQYLADPTSANPNPAVHATDSASGASRAVNPSGNHAVAATSTTTTSSTAGAQSGSGSATSSSNNANQLQVDALSSILQNLGMPVDGSISTSSATNLFASGGGADASTSTGRAPGATHSLTLADLQGAMANVPRQQQQQRSIPLNELVTPSTIQQILDNDAAVDRLLPLLPPGQQTREHLRDNLTSPPVQQTLRSLTHAILPDDAGRLDGLASVLANFGLNDNDNDNNNSVAMYTQDPIQTFLNAVLAQVEKEKLQEQEESKQDDEEKE